MSYGVPGVELAGDLPAPPHGEISRVPRPLKAIRMASFILYLFVTALIILVTCPFDRDINFSQFFLHKLCAGAKPVKIGNHADPSLPSFRGFVMSSHKSWVDFPTLYMFHGAAVVGRIGLAVGLPFIWVVNEFAKKIIWVKRGSGNQRRQRFEDAVVGAVHDPTGCGRVLIYPEGTRHREGRGVYAFKTGIFKIAFKHKIKLLIVPAEGAQYVYHERSGFRRRGSPHVFNYVGVINPEDFESWEAFRDAASEAFLSGYKEACEEYDRLVAKSE